MKKYLVCTAIGAVLSASAVAAGDNDAVRAAIADAQAVAPGGINDLRKIQIGGVEQWISVRGNNPANPILLFLHGGPGSPMMAESWTFQRPWEDFFTVVQWDQRGTGKTFSAANRKVDKSISIAKMQSDAEEVIAFLQRRYGKQKIFLLGHSWGSILGVRIAQHRPESLYAYIGVGQVVNLRRNEAVGYQLTLERARGLKNTVAINELESIAPYPSPDGSIAREKTGVERKWNATFGGMLYGHDHDNETQRWSISPLYSDYDVKSAELGESDSFGGLWAELAAVDFDNTTTFNCPVFIFTGVQDHTTPNSIAREYFQRITAPKKQLFAIDHAAHYPFVEAPGIFLMDLVTQVRPLSEPVK